MKKKSDRYRKFASSPDDEIADETCTTRLHAFDLAEVKALCVDGKTKSDVIRELVRRALYARRYRHASTDPAFREMLKTVDDMVGVRLHHLEQRLTARMDADFTASIAVAGFLYLAASFSLDEFKRVGLALEPEGVGEEEYSEAWEERFAAEKERTAVNLRAELGKRRQKLGRGTGGGDDD